MLSRDVVIESDPGSGVPSTPAYVALPEGAARYGIVVIHEVFGRQPDIDRACDRIAREGCAAVAPDLATRGKLMCMFDMMRALKTGKGTPVEQTLAARRWLAREASLPHERIALLGFCAGGGFALAAGRGWAAVSTNYGSVPELDVLEGVGPVVGCYGGRDRMFGRNKAALLGERLTKLGVRHEIHIEPEAGHSFLTDGAHPMARILMPVMAFRDLPEARERGWSKIFAFFDAQLGRQ